MASDPIRPSSLCIIATMLGFLMAGRCEATEAIVELCYNNDASVACVNRYATVLPNGFDRPAINDSVQPTDELQFEQTRGISMTDSSFQLLSLASFVVWDRDRGLPLLRPNISHEWIWTPPRGAFLDAPIYVSETNEFYVSQLSPNLLGQQVFDLNKSVPTMRNKTAVPPIYSAQGGVLHNDLIYYAVGGGNSSYNATPGVYTLNVSTGTSRAILNNCFGWKFNSVDDLAVDPVYGDIWFTDNDAAWGNGVNDRAPVLPLQTYRFRQSTGLVTVAEDTLKSPNGIAFSPDGKVCYIVDSGAITTNLLQEYPGYQNFNVTNHHAVYAFDVVERAPGKPYLANKRPVFQSKHWIPDGLKVSREGYVLVGTGSSVEVLDPGGELLLSIQTNYTAVNMNWAGPDLNDLWIVGLGGVSRVTGLDIHGQLPVSPVQ